MAVGDLSPDQLKFAQLVSAGTGLDPRVVTSWIGTESGWDTYKPTHNYLNIGPGHRYTSTEQAAEATIGLIRGSDYYSGIVASAAQGPGAQIEAIGSSKWGTEKKTLSDVFASLTGVRVLQDGIATPVDFTLPGWIPFLGDKSVPTPGDVFGSIGDDLSKVVNAGIAQILQGTLAIVFSAAAIGLIGLGVYKLSQKPPAASVKAAGDVVDKVTTVAGLVPTPQTKGAGAAVKAAKAL